MNTLIVVNGEQGWQAYFPGMEVQQVRLLTSRWLFQAGKLWVFDEQGATRVDAVLWRLGAIKPHANHRAVLEMLRFAAVPCVNPPQVLLRGYDRLSMLNELREAGLPLVPCSIVLGDRMIERLHPEFPSVLKIGNFHGGFGKARIQDEAQWVDIKDLAFVSDDYMIVEPAIDYVRDVRCLAVGERFWAMERRGRFWKVNTETLGAQMIDVPPILQEYTRRAMQHLQADVLALDCLQTADGAYLVLESNDTPGFSGFPDEARQALARRVRERMEGER
jgi:ribosomal protein S6--L-glutamate ligase